MGTNSSTSAVTSRASLATALKRLRAPLPPALPASLRLALAIAFATAVWVRLNASNDHQTRSGERAIVRTSLLRWHGSPRPVGCGICNWLVDPRSRRSLVRPEWPGRLDVLCLELGHRRDLECSRPRTTTRRDGTPGASRSGDSLWRRKCACGGRCDQTVQRDVQGRKSGAGIPKLAFRLHDHDSAKLGVSPDASDAPPATPNCFKQKVRRMRTRS